jgi:hypothetical protein
LNNEIFKTLATQTSFKLLKQGSWASLTLWTIKHKVCIFSFQVSRGNIMWQVMKSCNICKLPSIQHNIWEDHNTAHIPLFLSLLFLSTLLNRQPYNMTHSGQHCSSYSLA